MREMIAGVAHEIAQPLYAITNYAQACAHGLKEGPIDVSRLGEWMDGIKQAANNADEILRRMRDFTQQRQLKGAT